MKYIRAMWKEQTFYARLEGDTVRPMEKAPWISPVATARRVPLCDCRLLCPVEPGKIVAVGINYREHAAEMGEALPEDPVIFLKPPSAVIGPGEDIIWPAMAGRVDHEAELAVVMGRRASGIAPEQAEQFILGYTCANDVTARDVQKKDGQWTRGKGFDTFAPLGPCIETQLDTRDIRVEARVNGEVRQRSSTLYMIRDVAHLVSFISHVMTLEPGDVILTGTPSGIGPMREGDRVEVEIGGIGVLQNQLVRPVK